MTQDLEDPLPAVGVVVERGRGSLPFALIHGEPLVACAAWALGESGIRLVDAVSTWRDVVEWDATVVLHDALCPMTPPAFLAECVRRSVAGDVVVVGALPVTDTVKEIIEPPDGPVIGPRIGPRVGPSVGPRVGPSVDRDQLLALASPIVIPASVAARLPDWPPADFVAAVDRLRGLGPVEFAAAPPAGMRVRATADLVRLTALTGS